MYMHTYVERICIMAFAVNSRIAVTCADMKGFRIHQHTAALCNTLQHTATHCSTPQHSAAHWFQNTSTLQVTGE